MCHVKLLGLTVLPIYWAGSHAGKFGPKPSTTAPRSFRRRRSSGRLKTLNPSGWMLLEPPRVLSSLIKSPRPPLFPPPQEKKRLHSSTSSPPPPLTSPPLPSHPSSSLAPGRCSAPPCTARPPASPPRLGECACLIPLLRPHCDLSLATRLLFFPTFERFAELFRCWCRQAGSSARQVSGFVMEWGFVSLGLLV